MTKGKFDSMRDSALHYLCSSDWGNESFGDVNTYGVYIWRITLDSEEVSTANTEFISVIEDWEHWKEFEGSSTAHEFLQSLAGHFMVSENEQGQVTVKQYTLMSELIRHFNDMKEHYTTFSATLEEDN